MSNPKIRALAHLLKDPALLVTSLPDLFYLTGVQLEGFWLVVTRTGDCAAIASSLLAGHLRSLNLGITVIETANMSQAVGEYCRRRRIRSIAVDETVTTLALAARLKKYLTVVASTPLLTTIKIYKEKGEIKNIRIACAVVVDACRYARRLCKPGITEQSLYYKIEEYFARRGVKASFPTIVAFGPHAANPHHIPQARKLRKNDTVLLDMGCVWNGYCSDLTRTFFLGRMTGLQTQVFSCVKRAQQAAVQVVRAGVEACAVDAVARDLITAEGYGPQFIHTTGHGVGIEIHEAPRLGATDKTVLQAGMVVTVEPGIYLPGRFGVRIEDTVLVTHNGFEILTKE